MRIEGEGDRETAACIGEATCLVDEGAVAEMNAIEVTDRDRGTHPRGSDSMAAHDLHDETLSQDSVLDDGPDRWNQHQHGDRGSGERLDRR
jgi:hypothetical protein